MEQISKQDFEEIRKDVKELKSMIIEINTDLHRVRDSYIDKLKKIKKDKLVSKEEAEKELGVKFI